LTDLFSVIYVNFQRKSQNKAYSDEKQHFIDIITLLYSYNYLIII